MKTTINSVRVVVNLPTSGGESCDALLPLTINIEGGMLTIGAHGGPDLWRAPLDKLTGGET